MPAPDVAATRVTMSETKPLFRVPLMPLAGLAITLVAGVAAIVLSVGVARSNRWMAHAIQAQVSIVRVGERLAAFESAYRGYFVLASPEQRPEMIRTRAALRGGVDALRGEIADNPVQAANLRALQAIIERRIDNLDASARARLDPAAWTRILSAGASANQPLRNAVQAELQRMFAEEQRLLVDRQRRSQMLIVGLAAGLAIAVLLVVVVAYLTVTEARRRYAELVRAYDQTQAETAARQDAETRIAQLQKMETLGQLTGGIAHDFNNMLAVIVGSLDLAERHVASAPERVLACLHAARGGADRAAELVARLLAFARRQPLSPAPVDANALVIEMSKLLGRTLGEGIAIETHLAGGRPCGFADRGQVENAILNLAVNSRDAMNGRDGTITLVTDTVTFGPDEGEARPGRYVMIAVADTGEGMSAEVAERAIEPFFTTKDIGRGTGLGLSQVFGFVKQSGGHVTIESRIGEGTVVRLFLPRHDGVVAPAALAPRMAVEPPRGAGERVLVVEDEPLVRSFSAEALRDLGYQVIATADGAEALKILDSDLHLALLFTDLIMPGIGGVELAARTRQIRPELPILYTSGYRGGTDASVSPLLQKPFTMAQLATHVRDVIDG